MWKVYEMRGTFLVKSDKWNGMGYEPGTEHARTDQYFCNLFIWNVQVTFIFYWTQEIYGPTLKKN